MKQAVIKTGGKQYIVAEGQELAVELVSPPAGGKKLEFEPLLVFDDKTTNVGTPTISDSKVTAEVVEAEVKADKVKVLRYKAKKRVHKLTGHRQRHAIIKITTIGK